MDNQQQKRVFLDFLDQQGYMEEVHGMIGRQEKRLMLNLNHLRTFDNELTTKFMRTPGEYIPAFEDALREVIVQQDPTLGKTVAMHEFRIGIEGNFGSHHVSPRELSAYLLNGLVCVEGIVTKCSLVRPKIIKSTQFCQATNRYTTRDYRDNTSLNGPATGSAMPTKDQNGNPLQVEYGMSEYMDHQMISLQEMPERAPPGQLPRSIEVLLEGDLVDQCKPGDRVALSGIHRALPSKGSTTGMFATLVLGNNLRHFSKKTQGNFHEEDIANIKRLGKRPDAISLMATSLAPSIFGHNFEKTALLLMLLGGCEKNLANGTLAPHAPPPPLPLPTRPTRSHALPPHLRGDINVLLPTAYCVAYSSLPAASRLLLPTSQARTCAATSTSCCAATRRRPRASCSASCCASRRSPSPPPAAAPRASA
jgi:DNA replication licensing factor MCM3